MYNKLGGELPQSYLIVFETEVRKLLDVFPPARSLLCLLSFVFISTFPHIYSCIIWPGQGQIILKVTMCYILQFLCVREYNPTIVLLCSSGCWYKHRLRGVTLFLLPHPGLFGLNIQLQNLHQVNNKQPTLATTSASPNAFSISFVWGNKSARTLSGIKWLSPRP